MKEEYLHFLWRSKRFNFNNLKLANQKKQSVQIIETGWYNQDSGPDFFNGTISIDGIQWSGNIEIHIKSSDWYAHKHHLDKAYNNVILHVVYEHDKEVFVDEKPIPTIELKNHLSLFHFQNYSQLVKNALKIPCQNEVLNYKIQLLQQIDLSFFHRIERKGLELLRAEKTPRDYYTVFLISIFKSIGGKTNALPMQELAQVLSYKIIAKEKWEQSRIEALLFGAAGFLNIACEDEYYNELKEKWKLLKQKHQLPEMNREAWKFGGIRPHSYPTILLAQLSLFLVHFDFSKLLHIDKQKMEAEFQNMENEKLSPYWQQHFLFGKETRRKKTGFSQLFKTNLIINGLIPFMIALKHLFNEYSYSDRAIEIMEQLPPESNSVVKSWENIGFRPKNALQSQGLLELNNEFCTFKKCLTCKIGIAILSK